MSVTVSQHDIDAFKLSLHLPKESLKELYRQGRFVELLIAGKALAKTQQKFLTGEYVTADGGKIEI